MIVLLCHSVRTYVADPDHAGADPELDDADPEHADSDSDPLIRYDADLDPARIFYASHMRIHSQFELRLNQR